LDDGADGPPELGKQAVKSGERRGRSRRRSRVTLQRRGGRGRRRARANELGGTPSGSSSESKGMAANDDERSASGRWLELLRKRRM
jgi:hypothetical protein